MVRYKRTNKSSIAVIRNLMKKNSQETGKDVSKHVVPCLVNGMASIKKRKDAQAVRMDQDFTGEKRRTVFNSVQFASWQGSRQKPTVNTHDLSQDQKDSEERGSGVAGYSVLLWMISLRIGWLGVAVVSMVPEKKTTRRTWKDINEKGNGKT